MNEYEIRNVTAPDWMEKFHCLAGDCPETCCREWNIDVDAKHAERLQALDDPELQSLVNRVLRSMRTRRPGQKHAEPIHRLMLTSQPGERCPLLNQRDECRLQKKYGAYILCDTCYFYPRTFWQIDEETSLSSCLSCSECARLALMHEEPTNFTTFPAETDPNAEWLETGMISDPLVRALLAEREKTVLNLCEVLQYRDFPMAHRVIMALFILLNCESFSLRDEPFEPDYAEFLRSHPHIPAPLTSEALMEKFLAVFDIPDGVLEKPAQSMTELLRGFAGGAGGYTAFLAGQYEQGMAILSPFLAEKPHLMENFMVHCVFSDSFKQFSRYMNEPLTVSDMIRHECALLTAWYWFFTVRLTQSALQYGKMNEELFLQTAIDSSRSWWHYPDWFARCADRMDQSFDGLKSIILSLDPAQI